LPPRIFGCVCFVHQLVPGVDKLSPRAVKCIFFGYFRTQKGYRCYSPSLHRFFTCADVTFFESTPYYSESYSPIDLDESFPLPCPIPLPSPESSTESSSPPSPSGRLSRPNLQVYTCRNPYIENLRPDCFAWLLCLLTTLTGHERGRGLTFPPKPNDLTPTDEMTSDAEARFLPC
jgi:hypothetical protein